jgi:hypothetical protein
VWAGGRAGGRGVAWRGGPVEQIDPTLVQSDAHLAALVVVDHNPRELEDGYVVEVHDGRIVAHAHLRHDDTTMSLLSTRI